MKNIKKVAIAEPHGFCGNENFGVTRAIKIAQEAAKKYPGKTYLLGEIVHNQHIVAWLENTYGVKTVQRLDQVPKGATVIIRAHGVPPMIYKEAKKRSLNLIDATCPLVTQVHREVRQLVAEGKKILYVASDKAHDEPRGVVGEAPEAVTLTTLKELADTEISEPEKTVVLTQTTLSISKTKEVLDKLKKKYSGLTIKPHICLATRQRQEAVIKLARETGFVVIVGSPTSSNSNRLREAAESVGAKTAIIDTVEEFDPQWLKGVKKVAVSSGASTPEWLLKEVIEKIKRTQI